MNSLLQTAAYENKRIDELNKYNILDTAPEQEYQEIPLHASIICEAPMALLSFIDAQRQWFKATVGFEISEVERINSFCHHTLQHPKEILVVEDARTDARFKDNPFVKGEPNIVFYAGIPLFNKQGYGLGTICVIDMQPKTLNEHQRKALQILAVQAMHLLEQRRIQHEAATIESQPGLHSKKQSAEVFSNHINQSLDNLVDSHELLKNLYKKGTT